MANIAPRIARQAEIPATSLSLNDALSGAYTVEPVIIAETGQFAIFRIVDGLPYSAYVIPALPIPDSGDTSQTLAVHAGTLALEYVDPTGLLATNVAAGTYAAVAVADTGLVTSGTALINASDDMLYGQKANVTIANSAAEATLLNGAGTLTIPAGRLTQGSAVRITLAGFMSDNVTALGSGTIAIKVGATTIATATGIAGLALAVREWRMEFLFQCQTASASGKLIGQGYFEHSTNSDADLAWTRVPIKMTAQSSNIDLTTSKALAVTWTWDTADSGDTITCTNSLVELLG